ncbi:MAG: HAMP domain-containing protein, partial [Casimicrobiaceae bacterium]
MTLWPRSLFGRLMLLLVAVVALVVVTTALLFDRDRAALLARQFNDTKVLEVRALRNALAGIDPVRGREALGRLGREYGVRIVPESERPQIGLAVHGSAMRDLEERLHDGLGEPAEVRVAPRRHALFVHVKTGTEGYWIGFPLTPPPRESAPTRALTWALAIAVLLLIAAFAFARYLARPLHELKLAVETVGRGETPPVLPESGTSEIAAVNRGFNAMLASLHESERDRALLLAGVSHDLRTPLARLRLGIELRDVDEATRAGMVADIEEMDRIIGQFLDFARDAPSGASEPIDVTAAVAAAVDRYRNAGHDVNHSS